MPNAPAHRIGAGLAVGGAFALAEACNNEQTARPIIAAIGALALGTLPDILEPATSPNHRKFFHSVGMAGLVAYGMYETHQWKPDDTFKSTVRFCLLVAGGAYLVHLIMDASTPRGLPLL